MLASIAFLCLLSCSARADLWRTAYYPGWEQSYMPASSIDFTTLTHIIHFSAVPNSDGTLNTSDNEVTAANSADIISRAHAAGVKVIICVGGSESEGAFSGGHKHSQSFSFHQQYHEFHGNARL